MRTSRLIDIGSIEKRKKAQTEISEGTDSLYLRDIAINSLKRNLPIGETKTHILAFFNECANFKNANKNNEACLKFLEQLNGTEYVKSATVAMAKNVVPYIKDLDTFKESLARYNISNKDIIAEACDENKICQRILDNHDRITKRFNIDRFIKENYYRPLESNIIEICSMIDTFYPPAPVKLNSALEECTYIFGREGIEYDRKDLVKYVTEYFLHREQESSMEEFENYRYMLRENSCIKDSDLVSVDYFMEGFGANIDTDDTNEQYPSINITDITKDIMDKSDKINVMLNTFMISPDKREETFYAFIDSICELTDLEILNGLPKIMQWCRNYALNQLYSVEVVVNAWKKIIARFINAKASAEECENLIKEIEDELTDMATNVEDDPDGDSDKLYKSMESSIAVLKDYINVSSTPDAVKKSLGIKEVEGDLMKMDEFVNSPVYTDIDKSTTLFRRIVVNEISGFKHLLENADILLITEKEFKGNTNILDCICEDGTFDHILGIFDAKSDISDLKEDAIKICQFINSSTSRKTLHVYYEIVESIVEFHLENVDVIELTESEMEARDNCLTESDLTYFGILQHISETCNNLDIDTDRLMKNFALIENDLTVDEICGIIELSSYMNGLISYNRLNEIANNYRDLHPDDYLGNSSIKNAISSWKLEEADIDIVGEAVNMLNEAIGDKVDFKAKGNKNSDKKEDKGYGTSQGDKRDKMDNARKESRENSKDDIQSKSKTEVHDDSDSDDSVKEGKHKDKLSLNTLKMAALDLRARGKKLDDKARKISEELDMNANRFMKAVRELYTNDNREAVIRGSIIPSFHKLYQRAIVGVIGSGIVALINPAYAVATAALYVISLIGISKHNTAKERALLLDEIDIELDVIEKELSNAESKNQMKKYRKLLVHKKKLQREKQRIKYRLNYKQMARMDLPDTNE